MDFWAKQVPEDKTQTLKSKKSDPQAINFDDFQNFDNDPAEEKDKSDDLLQSQDLENSRNKIVENFLSNDDFHFQPPSNNNFTANLLIEKPKAEFVKKESMKLIKEERKPSFKREISKNEQKESVFCKIHDEEGGFFYCKDCQSFNICVQCIVKGFHKNHNVLNLKNSQFSLRQKYEEILNKLKEKNDEFQKKEKILNENMEKAKNVQSHNKHLVGVYFHEIREILDKKEKEFIEKIEEISCKNTINMKNSGDLIRKSVSFLEENLRNLMGLASSNEFALFKMILEGSLDSLMRNVGTHDATLLNNITKCQTQDEENLNKTMGKMNKFLARLKDSIENNEQTIEASEDSRPKKPINHDPFELNKPVWDDFKINENNIEEKTILVSLAKPQDAIFKLNNNFNTFNDNPPSKEKNGEQINRIENSLQRLRNDLKSSSPTKTIFNEYLNPYSSSNKEKHNHFDSNMNRPGLKVSSFNNLRNKGLSIKRSYIAEEINLKNSFLNKRTLLKRNNFIKDSKFFGFEEVKNSFFEVERTQRLQHFHNLHKNNIDKLTLKKDRKFIL